MAAPSTSQKQLTKPILFAPVDFVPLGDGTFRTIPRKPIQLASVKDAARMTGVPRQTIYNLYQAGFIEGTQTSPRKITIYMASLVTHVEAAKDPEFWTKKRRLRFEGCCRS